MDFGIGFLSNNVMLPILDFFYGIVPSYGFAIVALTLVIRFALYPLSVGQIRNMRRMRVAQPLMQKQVKEVQERYKEDPVKQREAMSEIYKEFGNPLAGCFPLLLQMPILFALFATLRGSPFSGADYTFDVQVLPREQVEYVQTQPMFADTKNVYIKKGVHYSLQALLPAGNKLFVGEAARVDFQTQDGRSLQSLLEEYSDSSLKPQFQVTKGSDRLRLTEDGQIIALEPGDATIQASLPGVARDEGFLFIEALGRIGVKGDGGTIHWDILGMVLFFGVNLYLNQQLSGGQSPTGSDDTQQQQQAISKITPVLFTGMFLFFPLPAGVLMYMTIANAFQTAQTFILSREPLPDNLQKIVDQQEKEKAQQGREKLPFEKRAGKKKEKAPGKG
ncbi:membrane protein insertase, YidC/Oxa1 family, C-terminal domain protein [Rubidibacter lacunae KORDI 51-2]|uniref:Membrane protein insertase, YidC/Oxa1 family, C-terminal domain protein n=1 Tax=Rubidibacter lacunae KORDI 51-2 TaxID=582515 RepID=U5DRS3_9CHRO|nr:membrane protein insertase YidC [Rubidibacter lacunae]ERN42390.1 membrane protein insertase, YidC/Oxa1 family, C-terminal domain protein [Rubidibacter lacunae KORDI 51-2]